MFTQATLIILASALISPAALAAPKPDPWIIARTKVALALTPQLQDTELNVDVFDGTVTLAGDVHSAAQARVAQRVCDKVVGVADVVNLLVITPTSSSSPVTKPKRSNADIKDAVDRALRADPALTGMSVSAKRVKDGVVDLVGQVPSPMAHFAALSDVKSVPGVRGIKSHVTEKNDVVDMLAWDLFAPANRPQSALDHQLRDARLTAQVRTRLLADPRVSANAVHVDTHMGKVTLFGVVDGPVARQTAYEEARAVLGVQRVENKLRIVMAEVRAPVEKIPDDDVWAAVMVLLKERGFEDVAVRVRDGKVTLTGSVPSTSNQLHSAMLARMVKGVTSVQQQFDTRVPPAAKKPIPVTKPMKDRPEDDDSIDDDSIDDDSIDDDSIDDDVSPFEFDEDWR